jgi:subfamily B ATP-binding cassette protein MsbA
VLTLGDLVLFVFLVGLVNAPLVEAAAMGADMGRAVTALGRVREVLSCPTERSADRLKAPVRAVVGTVTCDRVSYRYGLGPLVLRDVSFVAPAGSLTALVGPNGAGKSTLVGLLLGFDDPSDGRVLVDGRPLSMMRVGDYRRHLGAVLQRDQLLDGTIAENIRYGRPGASDPDFHRAACLAHCDEFVARLPLGYDTPVGERGARLSGGQRQRVAIARAFLADPRILLLDEVTAHLDRESEMLIREAIASLCVGRTTFVITHRLATITRADQILVLQSGAVVERGTHEELVARRGRYWLAREGVESTAGSHIFDAGLYAN